MERCRTENLLVAVDDVDFRKPSNDDDFRKINDNDFRKDDDDDLRKPKKDHFRGKIYLFCFLQYADSKENVPYQ